MLEDLNEILENDVWPTVSGGGAIKHELEIANARSLYVIAMCFIEIAQTNSEYI